MTTKKCLNCQKEFVITGNNQIYCNKCQLLIKKQYSQLLMNIKISKELHKQLKKYKEQGEKFEELIKSLLDYWIEGHKK